MSRRLAALLVVAALAAVAAVLAWPNDGPPPSAPVLATPTPAPAPPPARVAVPEPTLTGAETKEIELEGEREQFIERRYQPLFALPAVPRRELAPGATSVEAAMVSYAGALAAADWDWWLSLWEPEGRETIEANLRSVNREKGGDLRAEMIAGWKQEYAGRPMVLSRRIDLPGTGPDARAFAVIYFHRAGAAPDSPEAVTPLALVQGEDLLWRFSHRLVDHPVYFYDTLREEAHVRVVSK